MRSQMQQFSTQQQGQYGAQQQPGYIDQNELPPGSG
jgi:hypothetical protein